MGRDKQLTMSSGIKVYLTSISGSRDVKKRVQKIQDTLQGYKIDYEEIDVAADSKHLEEMRAKMNDHKAVVPQFFKDEEYLGVSPNDRFWSASCTLPLFD